MRSLFQKASPFLCAWLMRNGPVVGGFVRPWLVTRDGLLMSVQVSDFHYSWPKRTGGPWSQVEIGFPSAKLRALKRYAEDWSDPMGTVYRYVPVEVAERVIRRHGGIRSGVAPGKAMALSRMLRRGVIDHV